MNELLYKYKKSPITYSVIGICIVVYVVSVLVYGIEMSAYEGLTFGGYNPLLVAFGGDYYRLITANFIHFGLLHIVVNCYSMLGLGVFIENTLSRVEYIIILGVSALFTTLLPFVLFLINGFEANVVSGGISGVIFGLIGSLGALALCYKDVFMTVFKQLAPNVTMMLVISFIVPSISLSGHVSGMIGGFVATYIILKLKRKQKNLYEDLLN
ncbi:MAG: rhomboid family intramembrane serine protease [Erysipelotrichales bacterium]|nr:rhomboid family intramembrane serine protease [Erysipelotrichales bacterium]